MAPRRIRFIGIGRLGKRRLRSNSRSCCSGALRSHSTVALLYIGPDVLLSITSALAAIAGLVLMFWNRVAGMIWGTWRRVFMDAPLVGERPTRIIKTHLPTKLCPYSPEAKYVYVTRHPVSCFASIVDYNRSLLGPLTPSMATLVDWFCSDRMYWLPWPQHVAGWWQWAESRNNILFIHFEDMKTDFLAVCDRVACFLGYRLTASEQARVIEKCSFQYMQDHKEWFEMAPPTMFSVVGGSFMASGKASRHHDVTPEIRRRLLGCCRDALSRSDYPAGRFYPDLALRPAGGCGA